MRTKHIFTAMVLPALFAACTADDFEVVNNGATESQRPMLSGVTLNVVGDADTRYAVDENGSSLKFTYEDGDKIGAALIDNAEGQNMDKPEAWPITQTMGAMSNPFTYSANTGEWSTINSIGVGHYIFIYPYNNANIQRYAVAYELPIIQELYREGSSEVDLNAAIEKGNQAIYSDLLMEDDLVVDAYMRNLFAYPTFRVNIDNGQEVNTVSQIVLEYNDASAAFRVKGGLDHKKVYAYFSDDDDTSVNDHYDATKKATDWDAINTTDFLLVETSDYIQDKEAQTSKYLIAKFPEGTKFQRNANTQNKYIDVRFMIPGELMDATTDDNNKTTFTYGYAGKLKMHIYTDRGVYTIDDVCSAIMFNETTDWDIRGRVLARNTSYTLNLDKSQAKLGTEKFIVTTTKDWNDLVDRYGASKNYQSGLNVSIIGDEFSLDADTKFPTVAIFKVDTEMKVTGNVTVKNVEVSNTVTVEKDATLTTTKSFKATKVVNKGTLNITQVLDNNKVVNYGYITEIDNRAALNIEEDAEASFELTNKKGATVKNEGEITISGTNNGTIDNEGLINTIGFENASREYDDDDKLINTPTINIAAGARIVAQSGALTNRALIVNNGELTCQNATGTIVNDRTDFVRDNGTHKYAAAELRAAKAPSLTYITNNANGKVVVYEAKPGNLTINSSRGTVEYTTSAAAENFKDSYVNTVIASADYNVQDGNLTTLTIKATAKLTVGTNAKISNLRVNAGTTTLASNVTVASLTVAKDAQVTVPTNTTLTVSGNMTNNGRILVGGTLNATKVDREDAGNVENNGGVINFAPTAAEEEQQRYEAALDVAVAYYMDNATNYTNDSYEVTLTGFNGSYEYWTSQPNVPDEIATLAAFGKTVSKADLEASVSRIEADADNQKELVEALKGATLNADATLYDTKDAANPNAKPDPINSAYATFRANVINGTIQNVSVANSVKRTVNDMTTAEIDELLAEEKPTMYIWEGCDLDKAVDLWVSYAGKLDIIQYDDYSSTGTAANLVSWLRIILNSESNSAAVVQARQDVAALGININNYDDFADYTQQQVQACVDAE